MSKEEEGMVISGYAVVTLSVKMEFVDDEDAYGVPEICQHRMRVILPDPHVGKARNPDRFLSAGCVFGSELGRIANHFRNAIADPDDIAKGFAREMQDWDSDHNKKGKK